MNYVDVFKQCSSAIGFIENVDIRVNAGDGILGTAFLIKKIDDNKALFGTAAHVIQSCDNCDAPPVSSLEVRLTYSNTGLASMGIMDVKKKWTHQTHDTAIILAHSAGVKPVRHFNKEEKEWQIIEKDISPILSHHDELQLLQNDDLDIGEELANISFPEGKEYVFIDEILGPGSDKNLVPILKHGVLSQVVPAPSIANKPQQIFLFDIETVGGMSGSPIIVNRDNHYFVGGIVTHGRPTKDIGYAHYIKFLRRLLSDVETELDR